MCETFVRVCGDASSAILFFFFFACNAINGIRAGTELTVSLGGWEVFPWQGQTFPANTHNVGHHPDRCRPRVAQRDESVLATACTPW